MFPDDDENKPVWPSGLWATFPGGEEVVCRAGEWIVDDEKKNDASAYSLYQGWLGIFCLDYDPSIRLGSSLP